MIIDKIEVGKRLKLFAINYGGVTKLAQALEISGPNLSGSYISGKSVPGGELIARLMELGCDIDWLLTGKGNPKTITTDNDLINDFTMQEHGNRDLLKKDIAGRLNEYLETIKKRDSRKDIDIARALSMSPHTLYAYTEGHNIPGGEILRKLALILDLDINYLLTGRHRAININEQNCIVNSSLIQGNDNIVSNTITTDNTVEMEVLREKVKYLEDKNKLLEDYNTDLRNQINYLLSQLTKTNN